MMMTLTSPITNAVAKALAACQGDNVRSATVLLSPAQTVVVTRQRRVDRRDQSVTYLVTMGRPNYRSRGLIKTCKAAGEPFPVRKPQLRFWPAKKPKTAKRR